MPVAIMSGASFERMEKDLLPSLPHDADLSQLYIFSDTAAQCYINDSGAWKSIYKFTFTADEYEEIMSAFKEALEETGILKDSPRWGDLFLARDTQVTFAGLGVDASPEKKHAWDPDRLKRGEYLLQFGLKYVCPARAVFYQEKSQSPNLFQRVFL